MSKPFYRLNPEEFILWLTNFVETATVNQTSLPLTAAQIAALTARRDELQNRLTNKVAAAQAAEAADTALNDEYNAAKSDVSSFNAVFKANKTIPRETLAQLGLNVPNGKTSPPPTEPLDLTVNASAAGYNELRWKANGNKKNTIYIVEAQTGDKPDWIQVGAVSATRWTHQDQKPGTQVGYRVKATRAGQESAWCSPAVAYFNG